MQLEIYDLPKKKAFLLNNSNTIIVAANFRHFAKIIKFDNIDIFDIINTNTKTTGIFKCQKIFGNSFQILRTISGR